MSRSPLVANLDRALGGALALLMLGLVSAVTWQVASRYLLRDPSAWTEELARYLLIWIGLLGAAHAYRTRAHMGIDLLAQKVGPAGRARLRLISALAVLAFVLPVMIVGGFSLVQLTWELRQYSAALQLPMAAVYSAIPLSGAIIAVYAVLDVTEPRGENL